jgi:hypothetical protein
MDVFKLVNGLTGNDQERRKKLRAIYFTQNLPIQNWGSNKIAHTTKSYMWLYMV